MLSIKKDIKLNYFLLFLVIASFIISTTIFFLINSDRKTLGILLTLKDIFNQNLLLEKELINNEFTEEKYSLIISNYKYLKNNCLFSHKTKAKNIISETQDLFEKKILNSKNNHEIKKNIFLLIDKLTGDSEFLVEYHKNHLFNLFLHTKVMKNFSPEDHADEHLEAFINVYHSLTNFFLIYQNINEIKNPNKQQQMLKALENIIKNSIKLDMLSNDPIDTLMAETLTLHSQTMKGFINNLHENTINGEKISDDLQKNQNQINETIIRLTLIYQKRIQKYENFALLISLFLLFISCLAIINILFRYNKIYKNLNFLINETRQLDKDQAYRINFPRDSYSELTMLSETMNIMAEKIREMIAGLNEKVREKTEELTDKNIILQKEIEAKNLAQTELENIKNNLENMVIKKTSELIQSNKNLENEIEQRKKVENEMRKLINAIEHSPVSIVITDKKGNIEYVNPRFSEMTGYTFEEALGKNPKILKSGNHPDEFYKNLWKLISAGMTWKGEICNKKKTGELFWEQAYISPITDEKGVVSHFVAVKEDITQKRQYDIDKIKFAKLESLGLLAGGLAHDFNNLLMAILGNISLCQKIINKPEKLEKKLQDAEKACERATNLVNQLKTFSKGGNPIKTEINISKLIFDIASIVLSGSNIKWALNSKENLWTVEADSSQIEQVFSNLIVNARQAMPDGGAISIEIENEIISTRQYSSILAEGNYLKIKIKDTGQGIPLEIIPNIFDPYFTTKKTGSGLGLATTHSIIQKHNGYILVSSEIGAGTEFTIYLPATGHKNIYNSQESKDKNLFNPYFSQVNEKNTSDSLKSKKILIMDDELMIQETLSSMLSMLGYETEAVSNGQEAIKKYETKLKKGDLYDFVILDLTIAGGMGGKETIIRLKEINPALKAIVSSGYSNDPVMSQYKKFGFYARLSKPFTIKSLEETLKELE